MKMMNLKVNRTLTRLDHKSLIEIGVRVGAQRLMLGIGPDGLDRLLMIPMKKRKRVMMTKLGTLVVKI